MLTEYRCVLTTYKIQGIMKRKITIEQRRLINELLDKGEDRQAIANLASVTVGQVSAVAAHRTMGTYQESKYFSDAQSSETHQINSESVPTAEVDPSPVQSATLETSVALGMDIDSKHTVLGSFQFQQSTHINSGRERLRENIYGISNRS
jgi:hypothetical protein